MKLLGDVTDHVAHNWPNATRDHDVFLDDKRCREAETLGLVVRAQHTDLIRRGQHDLRAFTVGEVRFNDLSWSFVESDEKRLADLGRSLTRW
jgi:hypothetical protein